MLTTRGRLVLLLGAAIYVGAWAFGASALYPVAVGFPLAVVLSAGWVRLQNRPMELRRPSWGMEHVEGDDVPVTVELVSQGRLAPPELTLHEEIDRLGVVETPLRRAGHRLVGRYVLRAVPRGRYPARAARAVIEDPFGLERTEVALPGAGALLVYPRLVHVDRLFSEAGAHAHDGRRLLLRRPSGFDLHSVRDYEQGESLKKVHWPTTARRGTLMVKELEDSPRDEVAVLLDASAGVSAGEPPESSFDVQVRAAGSVLATHARRGRRAALVVNSSDSATQSLHGEDADWRRALELLAAVQANGTSNPAALLAEDASPAARALDLTVVTAQLPGGLVERLLQRALSRRGVSVVYVDPTSFAAAPRPLREPGLLRLQAAGVPVTVVRRGDDLAERLAAPAVGEAGVG